jgi:predicted secreted protein
MDKVVWILSSYFIAWWGVLFVILPLGVRSHADEGTTAEPGNDPGAPVNVNIKKKFLTTSWVTAILIAVIWTAIFMHWIPTVA